MPAADLQVDRAEGLTTHVVTGSVTAEDVIVWLERFYAESPTLLVLWDFSKAELSGLSYDGFTRIIAVAKKHAPIRAGGRTAIVVSSPFGYGMGRMYELLSQVQGHPIAHKVFRSRDEAMDWLTDGRSDQG